MLPLGSIYTGDAPLMYTPDVSQGNNSFMNQVPENIHRGTLCKGRATGPCERI